MANQNAVVGGINLTAEQLALLVRLQQSGFTMEQLQNGTDSKPAAPSPDKGIYWVEVVY